VIQISGVETIRRRREDVFDAVADERKIYDPTILRAEKLTPRPIGTGTRYRSETYSQLPPVTFVCPPCRAHQLQQSRLLVLLPFSTRSAIGLLPNAPFSRRRLGWCAAVLRP
jgi:hypothetical protein